MRRIKYYNNQITLVVIKQKIKKAESDNYITTEHAQ